MDRHPIRCLCCGVVFTRLAIYLHPSHRCVAPTPPERDTTTASTATGAVVVPLFGRRR